jgi:integrase
MGEPAWERCQSDPDRREILREHRAAREPLRAAEGDRLHAAWRLSLYGLRRGEVLGLRWADVDLKAKTLAVAQVRVLVDYKVRIEEPKSHNGKRTLPLDDELVSALTELRKRQARESEAAGTAYQAGLDDLDWYAPGDECVVTDELGVPVHPEWYSDEFGRLLKRARQRKIRLHDSRHTTLSLTSFWLASRCMWSPPGSAMPIPRSRCGCRRTSSAISSPRLPTSSPAP